MARRGAYLLLAGLAGVALVLLFLCLNGATPARAGTNIHCVNASGTGCGVGCGGGCYSSVQAAVNAATNGHEIRIAGGTYAPGGTVAAFAGKGLVIHGAYDPSCTNVAPDAYETVLDAGGNGSVISMTSAGSVHLLYLTLTDGDGTGNCGSSGCGGGIYAKDAALFVEHCVITGNVGSSTDDGQGGGISIDNSFFEQSISIVESQIVNNVAAATAPPSSGWGGGIYFTHVATADVLTNVVRGNRTNLTDGEGVGYGGGLYVSASSAVAVTGNRVEDNAANTQGGGVRIAWSDVHLARNRVLGNTGDGVYIANVRPVTLCNNLIANNATSWLGGGVRTSESDPPGSQVLLVNNTIADNGDKGIRTGGYAVLTLTNNLVSGHAAGISEHDPVSSTVVADTNLFWNTSDPITGTGGICQDPLLLPSYHLRGGSPAVDAALTISWLTTDLDGNPRPEPGGSDYDIGAFEGARWEVYLPLVLKN